jgi:OmpA-OmpF porin, OOP family
MKWTSAITMLTTLLVSHSALAIAQGPYLGAGAGVGTFKSPNKIIFNVGTGSASSTRGGLSGRAFAGFNFNDYIGVEIGYARYARSLYRGIANDGSYSSMAYYHYTYDLVAKAYLPFGHTGFNVYALAGAARVSQSLNYVDGNVALNGQIAEPLAGSTHTYKTRPIYGAGIRYDFSQQIAANVEYTQIRHLGDFKRNPYAIADMDLLTANLSYHFA